MSYTQRNPQPSYWCSCCQAAGAVKNRSWSKTIQQLATSEMYSQWVWIMAGWKGLDSATVAAGWGGDLKVQTLHPFGWPQGWEVEWEWMLFFLFKELFLTPTLMHADFSWEISCSLSVYNNTNSSVTVLPVCYCRARLSTTHLLQASGAADACAI